MHTTTTGSTPAIDDAAGDAPTNRASLDAEQRTHPLYRPDIDGLRAIAVLSVVAYHAFPATVRSGFAGVDVFFVISGFLITTILYGSLARDRFSLVDFYVRRVRRIFPALVIVVAATGVVGWYSLLDDQYQQLGKHVAAGAAFIANLVSWREAGYFDTASEAKPLLHLWSLGIEEQFYLAWPLILYAAWKWRIGPVRTIVAILVASFAVNVFLARTDAVADFYSPFTRFWELGLGAMLAVFTLRAPGQARAAVPGRSALSVCGAALLVAAFASIGPASPYPGWWALLPTFGTLALIAAGPYAWVNRQVLARRPLVWIGLISYPLYLWHWPLLSFIRILAAERPTRAVRLAAIAAAVLLAAATYWFVERPIRRSAERRWLVPALLVTMSSLGFAGFAAFLGDGFPSREAARAPVVNVGDIGNAAFFDYAVAHFAPCETTTIRAGAEAWNGIVRCWQSRPGPVDVALIGDSHAEHLFIGLAEALPRANVALWLRSSVPVASNPDFDPIFKAAVTDARVHTVILSAWWALRLGQIPGAGSIHDALDATIAPLVAAGKTVWIVDDVPNFSFDARLCKYAASGLRTHRCADPAAFYGKQLADYAGVLAAIAKEHPRVGVLEVARYFCDERTCAMARDGKLLYRDSDHLGVAGSQRAGARIVVDYPSLGLVER